MTKKKTSPADPANWHPDTQLVHGGVLRSQFAETSEALFLTQGYVYSSAEQAEARFKNEDPGYQYTRFGNPTVTMFEERLRLLEGAEVARATATGMAAVTASLLSFLKAGDHVVAARAMFGSCRYIVETLCPRFGIASTLIDGRDIDAWRKAVRPNTKALFFETPANPTLDLVDIAAVAKLGREIGALDHRRQRLRDADPAAPPRARRRHRRLLGDQAHRRPGPLPRRRRALHREIPDRPPAGFHPPDRALAEPVQRLGHAEGPRDAPRPRQGAMRDGGQHCRSPRRVSGRDQGHLLRARRSSSGRTRQKADDRRRPDRDLRDRGRQGRRLPLSERSEPQSRFRTISATPRASSRTRRRRPTTGSERRPAPSSASRTACCACRSVSRRPRILPPTSTLRLLQLTNKAPPPPALTGASQSMVCVN